MNISLINSLTVCVVCTLYFHITEYKSFPALFTMKSAK